jgi:hypothetical protein
MRASYTMGGYDSGNKQLPRLCPCFVRRGGRSSVLCRWRSISVCLLTAASGAFLTLAVVALAIVTSAAARGDEILQKAHVWGRFPKGSWRQVKVITENFDEQGRPSNSSITDNTTTLQDVTGERVTLKVEVTVEVVGRTFPSRPQIVRQGYAGENVGQTVSTRRLEGQTILVDGRRVACETQQIEIVGGPNKETSLICFSPRFTPAILKRQTITTDAASAKTTLEATSEVYALDKPLRVLDEIKTGYCLRIVQTNEHGVTTTWSDRVPEVPGEIVAESSKKVDPQGRLVRRSTLELIAYGLRPDEARPDSPGRRMRRHKRSR